MDLAKHCQLCDHQKVSLEKGTICGITQETPKFQRTCPKIQLNQKFENILKDIGVKHNSLEKKKVLNYTYFITFILIGISVSYSGYYLGVYAWGKGVVSTVPLLLILGGFAPIMLAVATLRNYLQDLKIATEQKSSLDEILELYRIRYDLKISPKKPFHGEHTIRTELSVRKPFSN
jgi:hypothetical protein